MWSEVVFVLFRSILFVLCGIGCAPTEKQVLASEQSSGLIDAGSRTSMLCNEPGERKSLNKKASVKRLLAALNSADNAVRWQAAVSLGERGSSADIAIPALIAIVESKAGKTSSRFSDDDVRAAAAYALGQIGANPKKVVSVLTTALADDSIDVRKQAAMGLGMFGAHAKPAIPHLIKQFEKVPIPNEPRSATAGLKPRHWAATSLALIGGDSVRPLVAALQSQHAAVRVNSLETLSYLGKAARSASARIAVCVDDRDQDVRAMAAHTLGIIKANKEVAIPALIKALRDSSPRVRVSAGYSLERFGRVANEAVPTILKAIDDKHANVRVAMCHALSTTASSECSSTVLASKLKDPSHKVRGIAAYLLGRLGDGAKNAVAALRTAQADKNEWVRGHATAALRKIQKVKQTRKEKEGHP